MSLTDSHRERVFAPHPLITTSVFPLTDIREAPAEIRVVSSGRFLLNVPLRFLTNLSALILCKTRREKRVMSAGVLPKLLPARDSTRQSVWVKWRSTTIHLSPLLRRQAMLRFAELSAFLFVNKQRENSRSQYKEQNQHAWRQCCVYSEELKEGVKVWGGAVKFDLPGPVKRTV